MRADLPIFPWAETNQGVLTLVALFAAIGVAWFEHRRAEGEGKRRVVEYEAALLRLVEDFEAITRKKANFPADVMKVEVPLWNDERVLTRKTLDSFRQTAPADGRLLLVIKEFDTVLRPPYPLSVAGGLVFAGDPRPKLNEVAEGVARVRAQLLGASN